MKLKNLSFNKKKCAAILTAAGLCLCKVGVSEIISYNTKTTLTNGNDVMVYFSYGTSDDDYSYVSFEDKIGYIKNCYINRDYLYQNNDFTEINKDYKVEVDSTYLFQYPNSDAPEVGVINKDSVVRVIAKSNDGWCVVNVNNSTGFIHESAFIQKKETISYAKITGNNINVRSSASTKKDNIIGFCDITDTFRILSRENGWYIVDYLGQTGYISAQFVKEVNYTNEEIDVKKIVYMSCDSPFYSDLDYNIMSYLPQYQDAFVVDDVGDLYKVRIDGVEGYINKGDTEKLSKTFVLVDLSRQILKVYKNNEEVFRTHIISGRKSLKTHLGAFKIGHKVKGYQLTIDNYVDYWMEFDGNIGLHDADWQKDKYYKEVAIKAYDNYSSGLGKEYPTDHGSHGCCNLKKSDAKIIYNLVSVGDNVLVIGSNSLIKNRIITGNAYLNDLVLYYYDNYVEYDKIKIKKLV